MAGLLDWVQTPEGIGLLSAVAGGMAGARRGQPINSMGRGLVTGLQGYAGAQDQIRQEQENAFQKRYREMQMQKIESELANQKGMRESLQSLYKPAGTTPFQADNPFGEDLGTLQTETPATFGGKPVDPVMAAILPYSQPDDILKMVSQQTPIKLGKGDRLVDPTTYQPLTNMPPMQDDQPDKVRQYQFAVENDGFKGSYIDFLKIVPEAQAAIMYPWRAAEASDRDRRRVIDERKADYELPRGNPRPQTPQAFSVRAPDGNTYSFPTKAAADQFKRSIGGQ